MEVGVNHPDGDAVGDPDAGLDGAAARGHVEIIFIVHVETERVFGIDFDHRFAVDFVQAIGSARHFAAVPMIEDAPR